MSVGFSLWDSREEDAQTHIFKLFNKKKKKKKDLKPSLSRSVLLLVCLLSWASEQWCLLNILARIIV